MKLKASEVKKAALFVLPSLAMISQNIRFSAVNLSFLLYILMGIFLVLRAGRWTRSAVLCIFTGIVLLGPFVPLPIGGFSVASYFSIATGLVYSLFIVNIGENYYDSFLKGCLFSCFLFTVWGVFEILTGKYLFFSNEALIARSTEFGLHYPGVVFTNTNDLAQYLVILFPVTLYFLMKKPVGRVLLVLGVIGVAAVAFFSGSRMSMIAIVLSIAITYLVVMAMKKKGITVFWGLVLLLVVIAGLIVFDAMTGVISGIIEDAFRIDTSNEYYTGRSDIYRTLFREALKRPLGSFGSAYRAQEMPPHNLFLFILCDYGWLPAGLFAVSLVVAFCRLIKKYRKTKDVKYALLVGAVCMFPITSSISSVNEQRKITWIFAGILLRECMKKSEREKIEKHQNGSAYETAVCNDQRLSE